ncbi:MAG: hypothetical protein ACYC8T_08565 [Myxococcaceae bacterium]
MGLGSKLKKEALALSQRAMERIFSNEKRAMRIAEALGTVQRGKAVIDKGQDELMHQLSIASRGDYKALGKQLSGLKRRIRELSDRLDEVG